MFRKASPCRWLLTVALALSTSVGAMLPSMAASVMAATPRPTAEEPSASNCCCGTQSAGCCGMGCCTAREAPAPGRHPAPLHEEGSHARPTALALVWNPVCLPAEPAFPRPGYRDGDAPDRLLSGTTLQAQSVRLDA